MKQIKPSKSLCIFLTLFLLGLIQSCSYLPEVHLKEVLRPVRKLFNKERTYWTDKIEYRGESGSEIVYYKNGRPALERIFDETGLLRTISYFDRRGEHIRMDSLVYAGEELISGYYFAEPDHQLILHFINYKQQHQLSQRSWFDGDLKLLSREFFLFDLKGQRRMRMIFDGDDVLLFTETFKEGTDGLELQNTYDLQGVLRYQVRYPENKDPVRYEFDTSGQIMSISQLRKDGSVAWTNHLLYNASGAVIQSNFSTESRFLVSYMGDLEFFQQQAKSWKHPLQPTERLTLLKYEHMDPFVREEVLQGEQGRLIEYRFPKSKALFKSSLISQAGLTKRDTLFGGGPNLQPLAIIDYDNQGQQRQELTYDLRGDPRWRRVWFRDDQNRTIREEVTALPDTFTAAITRFYDCLGAPAFSERFTDKGLFEGTWVNYHGGGLKKTLFYDENTSLSEAWLFRPAGDTVLHSKFTHIDYFTVESKLGPGDTLRSQTRYTADGLLDWELVFESTGQLLKEIQRKKNGDLYREVLYDPLERTIKSTSFAPTDPEALLTGKSTRVEISSQVVSKLNAGGELVQLISRNTSGDVAWETRHAYRKGRLVKSAQLDAAGKIVVISKYTHDEKGRVLTETAEDKLGGQVHYIEYKYDETGRMIYKMFQTGSDGPPTANRYYYTDEGLLQRNEIIENLSYVEAVEYEYHPDQYLRVAIHLTPEGELLRKEIENYFGDNVFSMATSQQN